MTEAASRTCQMLPAEDQCPACGSPEIEILGISYRGHIVVSNWAILPDAELRPCCCRGCGLIYESRGVRQSLSKFYEEVFAPTPLMRFYGDGRARLVDLLNEIVPIPAAGRLLEIGSGRGQFLRRFHELHPQWQLTAIEPSISFETLRQVVPAAEAYRCGYETFACAPESKDVVVALSVIQSVENPLMLLKWSARALRPGGICFLEASNFETHPSALVCGDHLSKLTPASLENLADRAGFAVEAIRPAGVPMFAVLRRVEAAGNTPPSAFSHNLPVARRNERRVKEILRSVADARAAARRSGEGFAIFGLATAGLAAPFMLGFPPSDITALIDDNRSAWGTQAIGRPIIGPDQIHTSGIKHIALSMSPIYAELVSARLRLLDVTVYAGSGETA